MRAFEKMLEFFRLAHEKDLIQAENEASDWRERAMSLQSRNDQLEKDLTYSRGKIDQLIDMLVGEKTETINKLQNHSEDQPISIAPVNWLRARRDLERKHSARIPREKA